MIASLATARRREHRDAITGIVYDLVIVDEAHHLKNRASVSWKFVNALQKKYILMLTATPVQKAEVAERHSLDLLHVHYAIPHSISALLARSMLAAGRRLPFITTLHGTDITLVGRERSYFPITKFSIDQSDGVTAVSEYLRAKTVEVFGTSNEIRVIRNFVNCDLYKPAPETRRDNPYTPRRREGPAAHLQLPAREADTGLHPHPCSGPPECGRAPSDDRRRARARPGREPGPRTGAREPCHLPG